MDDLNSDWRRANKKQLLDKLLPTIEENRRLRESVERLMKSRSAVPVLQHVGRLDDFVPAGWPERYGITIPRADGYFESAKAWVRITHGVITNAGLKNRSILSVMMSSGILDDGAQKHASLYIDWRAAFFARVEAARYSNSGCGDPEAWSKEDRFSKLIRAVDKIHLRRMDIVVTGRPKEKDVAGFHASPNEVLSSFMIVAKAIGQINRDAEQYLTTLRGPAIQAHSLPQPA